MRHGWRFLGTFTCFTRPFVTKRRESNPLLFLDIVFGKERLERHKERETEREKGNMKIFPVTTPYYFAKFVKIFRVTFDSAHSIKTTLKSIPRVSFESIN